MKIGILSDIHGNADALAEVLKDAQRSGVVRLCVLGDIVGYYYHPDKVLASLSEWDYLLIRGNHEDILQSIIAGNTNADTIRSKYGSGHRFAMEKLSEEQLDLLFTAPPSLKLEIDGVSVSLNHGATFNQEYYLYPDTEISILEQCDDGSDFVFVGHSHYPFVHRNRSGLLVNVGSVGQSRIQGGIASWCLLDTTSRSIQMKTTPYDTRALQAEVKETDPQIPYLLNILTRNAGGENV